MKAALFIQLMLFPEHRQKSLHDNGVPLSARPLFEDLGRPAMVHGVAVNVNWRRRQAKTKDELEPYSADFLNVCNLRNKLSASPLYHTRQAGYDS